MNKASGHDPAHGAHGDNAIGKNAEAVVPARPAFDPIRIPDHMELLFERAETAGDVARAMLIEDLCNERCS